MMFAVFFERIATRIPLASLDRTMRLSMLAREGSND
jgi:hypothetical protein